MEILGKICEMDITLDNESSFENNFKTLCVILNNSINDCFHDDKIYLPDFVNHVLECSCTYCSNPHLQKTHIQLYLQYISGKKAFHNLCAGDLNWAKAIDDLTHNAKLRFHSCLENIKSLIGFEGDDKKKEKKVKELQNNQVSMFSKYIAKAKVLSIEFFNSMTTTVDQVISQLEFVKPIEHSEFNRLIAQLYYLQKVMYFKNKTVDSNINPVEENKSSVQRKTKSLKERNHKIKSTRSLRGKKGEYSKDETRGLDLKTGGMLEERQYTDCILSDLKKVLTVLNSYTDTLIIKSIYQLISFIASYDNKPLAISSQFLSCARTLHQQVLHSVGKKLRWVRLYSQQPFSLLVPS